MGTHSLRLVFSMEIFLAQVYPETTITMGRYYRKSFLRYIRIQLRNLSKGTSALMVGIHAVYEIPEAEVIHYNLEQSVTHTWVS